MAQIKARNKIRSLSKIRSYYGYVFIMPWLIGVIGLFMVPFIKSIIFSINQIKLTGSGYELIPVGLDKFKALFLIHPVFTRTLVESIQSTVVSVPLIVAFSLFCAILINQKFRGRTAVRAILFLPVVMGSGVILMLQQYPWLEQILQGHNTMNSMETSRTITRYLQEVASIFNIGLIDFIVNSVGQIRYIIQSSGIQILIFLAGLQSISPSIYEASKVEGATGWENFWKITLPMISPIILVNLVYSVIDSFTTNYNNMMVLIKDTAFKGAADLSSSSAMALVYFACIAVLLMISVAIISRRIFYEVD